MKLHLGCGNIQLPSPPWINIDRRYQPAVDELDDIGVLHRYAVGSIEEIYCCHAIDHFTRWQYPHVFRRWSELLKPGGLLYLSTPDFDILVAYYVETNDLRRLIGPFYAGQEYEENTRHVIFNAEMLTNDLIAAGFTKVQQVGWEAAPGDWPTWEDCSQARLPDGRRLSLNVIAAK